MPEFCHLHCHTQYSLLDGANDIKQMMTKAAADGQKAVALTDHGNMFGAFSFFNSANNSLSGDAIMIFLLFEFHLG